MEDRANIAETSEVDPREIPSLSDEYAVRDIHEEKVQVPLGASQAEMNRIKKRERQRQMKKEYEWKIEHKVGRKRKQNKDMSHNQGPEEIGLLESITLVGILSVFVGVVAGALYGLYLSTTIYGIPGFVAYLTLGGLFMAGTGFATATIMDKA